ncbi:MAG: SH3 domain-containing protein [Anaerolineaceae bacterium]|nr:SH3 domain-containing protein [Anaerolineaceae bacterium]NTV35349.1 SH3 domain-containing protein [Anaerolineaceae bacterium]
MKIKIFSTILIITLALFSLSFLFSSASANPLSQQPTGSIATVTGTASGPLATVKFGMEEQVNVRAGPNTTYATIGVLLPGQSVPALGRTSGGGWVMIEYIGVPGNIGWVWSNYIDLSPGDLPIKEPPPEPTPVVTQTIDPTLAAQFIVQPNATRLPTFTPAPTIEVPKFEEVGASGFGSLPMGLVILVLIFLGVLVGVVSFIQPR